MEWINVIVTAICSLLAAVGGGTVMFYKQNRKLKDAEVIHTQADEWKRFHEVG